MALNWKESMAHQTANPTVLARMRVPSVRREECIGLFVTCATDFWRCAPRGIAPRWGQPPFLSPGSRRVLPPSSPLRTGREGFPSSGSSRYKAPRERSRFHNGFNPGLMAMDAELLVERTVHKIRLPLWVERVGVLPDFDVPPDFGFARIH